MQVATSINCFFDDTYSMPVEAQIGALCDAGFRALDMNFWDWCHDARSPFVGEGWADWVRWAGESAARRGARFVQAHAHVCDVAHATPEEFALLERSVRGAALLGVPWVVFHPCGDCRDERTLALNARAYAHLAALAAELGTGIALENMSRPESGPTDGATLARLVDALDSPAVGACWDTGHAHIAGVDQVESLRALGGRLKALHVQDNDAHTDAHTAPFFGTIDWDALMGALRETGYAGPFTFEAHNLVRRVPERCRPTAARLLWEIGAALVEQE